MILAEKIMKHRKQNGWSQEELAVRLKVSRQSVSKWESGASLPDLDKILKLGELFGVSTDYLLKDEIEEDVSAFYKEDAAAEEESTVSRGEDPAFYKDDSGAGRDSGSWWEAVREVTLEEANTYMELVQRASVKIAAGVAACVISPVPLILMGGLSEYRKVSLTENMAGGIGVAILLLMVAAAVAVFILYGAPLEKYGYMEKEALSLQYGVAGIVEVRREEFMPVHRGCTVFGVSLCIVSVVPLMVAAAFDAPDLVLVYCVDVILVLVAVAVFLFTWSGMIYGSYQKLLEEGEYTREKKLENKRNGNLATVYWCTVTAIYLGVSFLTGRWEISWVIWACAGVFYAAVRGLAAMLRGRR